MFRSAPLKIITRGALLVAAVVFSQTLLADDATTPSPDTLKLKDGSVLFGKLLSGDSGTIDFESQHAGTLSIPINNVAELASEQVVVFKFQDGRLIRLPKVTLTDEPLTISTKDGVMSYSLADIAIINPEPWMLGVGHHWTGSLIFALELQSGNTDKQEIDVDLNSVWRRSDRFLSDTTYAGANLYFEADEFSQLKRRHMLTGYYGKQWRSTPRLRFSTEPGLAFVSETRTELEEETYFAFSWNMDMHSNYLGPNTDTYLNQVGVWNLEDSTDIVVNTRIGLKMPVRPKITVNTQLKLEYDSGAPVDVKEMDTTFTIGLGYRW